MQCLLNSFSFVSNCNFQSGIMEVLLFIFGVQEFYQNIAIFDSFFIVLVGIIEFDKPFQLVEPNLDWFKQNYFLSLDWLPSPHLQLFSSSKISICMLYFWDLICCLSFLWRLSFVFSLFFFPPSYVLNSFHPLSSR